MLRLLEKDSASGFFWFVSSDVRCCSLTISIERFWLQYSSVFFDQIFEFLLSLIVACCPVFVNTRLQACVAGCFHLRWGSFFLFLYACCFAFVTYALEFPRSVPSTKTKGKAIGKSHQKQTNLWQTSEAPGNPHASQWPELLKASGD